MSVHAILQIISVAIILHVYRTDPRFKGEKSHLDKACDFGVASAVISVGTVLALALTGAAAGESSLFEPDSTVTDISDILRRGRQDLGCREISEEAREETSSTHAIW